MTHVRIKYLKTISVNLGPGCCELRSLCVAGQVSLLPDDLARMSRRPYRNLQTELN